MAFSGFGADTVALPGVPGATGTTKKQQVSPEVFLIAQLNRFKGPGVPAGQQLGETKFSTGNGISASIAIDALTVTIRRLQSSLEILNDEGARTLLAQSRGMLTAGDNTGDGADAGAGALIAFVKAHALEMGNTIAAFADSLGLPPAELPISVLGLSGVKLAVAAGAVGVVALLLLRRR